MDYQNIIVENRNGVVVITLNRPKALNALNGGTFADLRAALQQLATEPEIKGLILMGAGEKAFVAGADISEFTELDAESGYALAKNGQDVFFMIERFAKPVIAVVNGFALGGGCELAMACHLRVATEKARFGQPEVNLGIIPGYGGTQRLIQYIGKTKAIELLMTGDMMDAAEAYRLGLLNYVLPTTEEALAKATELIEKIATKAPIAISKVIDCVNAYFKEDIDGFEKELQEFSNTVKTADFKEGATAFLEKRKANFVGK